MTLQQTMYALIEAQRQSGQSITDFCAAHQLTYAKFHYWCKRQAAEGELSGGFIQLNPNNNKGVLPPEALTLHLPDGSRLSGSARQLAQFYHHLQNDSTHA